MESVHGMSPKYSHAVALDLSRKSDQFFNVPIKEYHQERSLDESMMVYREGGSPPSFYPEVKDINSPQDSRQSSPTYASCYPGAEQLNQYVLQTALHQRLQMQARPKMDSDAVSEDGSEGSHSMPIYSMIAGRDGKMTRPFKAYPKDPLSFTAGFSSVDSMLDTQSAEKYAAFRKSMLDQICAANGGQATVSNPKMRRTVNTNNNNYNSDDGKETPKGNTYSERRQKNNAAAKKSRDRRRIKEDEIAIRAAFLERENIELKFELAAARKQLAACGISSNSG